MKEEIWLHMIHNQLKDSDLQRQKMKKKGGGKANVIDKN